MVGGDRDGTAVERGEEGAGEGDFRHDWEMIRLFCRGPEGLGEAESARIEAAIGEVNQSGGGIIHCTAAGGAANSTYWYSTVGIVPIGTVPGRGAQRRKPRVVMLTRRG